MSTQTLVSAVIIFLNEERFITEAIESVFAQTYPTWELLLVDDGSTDTSTSIARRYAAEHPGRVRYLEHPDHQNLGMSASRNLGVRRARGEYLAYLDADDVWLPHKLARQLEILQAHPQAAMVCSPLTLWFSWETDPSTDQSDALYGVGADGVHPYANRVVEPPELLCLFLREEQYIPSGFLIKHDVIVNTGTYEDIFRDAYSDAVSLVKVCLMNPVFISSESWYLYRKHTASSTYQSWQLGLEEDERRFYLNWVERYLKAQGVRDPKVWEALHRAQFPYRHPNRYRAVTAIRNLRSRISNLIASMG